MRILSITCLATLCALGVAAASASEDASLWNQHFSSRHGFALPSEGVSIVVGCADCRPEMMNQRFSSHGAGMQSCAMTTEAATAGKSGSHPLVGDTQSGYSSKSTHRSF